MYTRILVPLDGSAVAEEALAHAAQMADLFGAELILLRTAFLPQTPDLDLAEVKDVLVRESEVYLGEMARQLQEQGQRVRTMVYWRKAAEACRFQSYLCARLSLRYHRPRTLNIALDRQSVRQTDCRGQAVP